MLASGLFHLVAFYPKDALMTRCVLTIAAFLLLSCGGSSRSLDETVPVSLDGWTRSQISPLPPAEVPEVIRGLGLAQAVSATYTGPSTVSVRVFRMKGQTSAFELIQKWRQSDGLAVYSGPYFLVADPGVGPGASRLLQALQKSLQ